MSELDRRLKGMPPAKRWEALSDEEQRRIVNELSAEIRQLHSKCDAATERENELMKALGDRDRLWCEAIVATQDPCSISERPVMLCDVVKLLGHFNKSRPANDITVEGHRRNSCAALTRPEMPCAKK